MAQKNVKATVSSIGQGTPPPASKYGSAPRPTFSDEPAVPRGDASMSDGTTGGNFRPYGRPNSAGPDPTSDGAQQAIDARESK